MSYFFYDHTLPSLIKQIRKIKKLRETKYYAVAVGRRVGIYRSWSLCKAQIDNISNAKYGCFLTSEEALNFLSNSPYEKPIEKMPNDKDQYEIVYVDGSCWRNGMSNAQAGVGVYWPDYQQHNQSITIDGRQTSIRAEIWSAIFALRKAKQLGFKKLIIYTDSRFVIQTATNWLYKWKKNNWVTCKGKEVRNRYDIMALDEAVKSLENVIWSPVAAHSGVYGNEQADKLANFAISRHKDSFFEEPKSKQQENQNNLKDNTNN